MISKLNIKDNNLINELVNFIFVKQNSKNYKFKCFPSDFYWIRKELKKQNVFYIKENTFNLIIITDEVKINYLYFEKISYLKNNLDILHDKELLISKDNYLINDLVLLNKNNRTTYILALRHNNQILKHSIDKRYIVVPLNKHLVDDYLRNHSNHYYQNHYVLVCIKNNEMIGYLDYKGSEILEINSLKNHDEIYKQTIKQLLLNYLKTNNQENVIYQTKDIETCEYLIAIGFEKVEENILLSF